MKLFLMLTMFFQDKPHFRRLRLLECSIYFMIIWSEAHSLTSVVSFLIICENYNNVIMQFNLFVQEAHPAEGLEQVGLSMDLIEQLMVLTSSNVPPDVAALLLSPRKRRWGEDSDPTTPLGGRTFSDYSEEVSPICQTGNWDVPQGSTMHSLPPGE